jgi:hypothetical protein
VAAVAFPWRASIDIVLVAGAAILGGVDSPEREDTAVVKIRLVPIGVRGFMAQLAGRRKTGGHMIRVSRLLIIGAMAAITFPRSPGVNAVFMTGRTLERGMNPLAGKYAVMVEGGLIPAGVGRQMAELAGRRKSRLSVVGLGSLLIVLPVAGIAVKDGLAEVSILVAVVTA